MFFFEFSKTSLDCLNKFAKIAFFQLVFLKYRFFLLFGQNFLGIENDHFYEFVKTRHIFLYRYKIVDSTYYLGIYIINIPRIYFI